MTKIITVVTTALKTPIMNPYLRQHAAAGFQIVTLVILTVQMQKKKILKLNLQFQQKVEVGFILFISLCR